MRKAIVKNGKVVNVVEVKKSDDWTAPDDCEAVNHETAGIGWTYEDGELIEPEQVINQKPDLRPEWEKSRSALYAEKEASGDLPATIQENIDELWKALETAELHGIELPPRSSSIIRQRRAVKTKYPKEGN